MENAKENKTVLAINIKRLRKQFSWNQDDLAERAELSKGAIRTIETGVRWPRPATLKKLAKAFGVVESELFALRRLPEHDKDLASEDELETTHRILFLLPKLDQSDKKLILRFIEDTLESNRQTNGPPDLSILTTKK